GFSALFISMILPPELVLHGGTVVSRRGLWGGLSAVDVQGFTHHITGFGRGEKNVGRGQFHRLSGASQRDVVPELGQLILWLSIGYLQRGPDWSRSDAVDTNSARSQLHGQSLSEGVDRGLRRGVIEQ